MHTYMGRSGSALGIQYQFRVGIPSGLGMVPNVASNLDNPSLFL